MNLIQESFDRYVGLSVYQTLVAPGLNGSTLTQVDPIGKKFASKQFDGSPGYRIRFKVDKVVEVTPNPTSIYIYNLSQISRALLRNNNIIELEAGYGDSGKRIFKGNISRVRTRKEGPDYVTQIEAADGLFAVQNSRIDMSFRQPVSAQMVISTLVGAITGTGGVQPGQILAVKPDIYNKGIVLSGNAIDRLKEVCERSDLQFSIQDGKINIIPIGSPAGVPAFVVSTKTGLVGIPEQRDVGVSFKMLLNPEIVPFQPIVLLSKFLSGVYTSAHVVHTGDSWGGEFFTEVEAS